MENVFNDVKHKMDASINHLIKELNSIRTGRASIGLLDGITVDYYGAQTPLNQIANLSLPDPLTIGVQPWEPAMTPVIERAILASDLGLTPLSDGKMIHIPIPSLTEERRKDLSKVVRKNAEDAKIAVRNVRREGVESLKKLEKQKDISEDDSRGGQDKIQKITDEHISRIDKLADEKEKEIMDR